MNYRAKANLILLKAELFERESIWTPEFREELLGDIVIALEEAAEEVLIDNEPAFEVTATLVRNEALEEAAKIFEFHSGPSIEGAEKVRALKTL